MDALTINPFIESVGETFQQMVGVPAEMGQPRKLPPHETSIDIIGVIGLTGTAQGTVALRFPVATAMAVVSKMVGSEVREVNGAVVDGIGELVNIVAGSAKARFGGHKISISLPTVVRGDLCRLTRMPEAVSMEIPFASSLGQFWMIVTVKATMSKGQEKEHESAHR